MCQNFIKTLRTKPLTLRVHAVPIFSILKAVSLKQLFLGYKEKTGKGFVSFLMQLLKLIK